MAQISVIMAVYNTPEPFLREAIESILGQTVTDFEFIIVDDGSTLEHVARTIKSYQDVRIRYVYQDNTGIAGARNLGLQLARGDYIAVMDSDDVALPKRFETQIEYLSNHPDVSVCGTWFEMFPEHQIIKHPPHVHILDLLKCCCIGHPTVMWKRADLCKYELAFYDTRYHISHDYELWSRVVQHLKVENIQEVLLRYRQHEGNITKKTERLCHEDAQIHQNIRSWLTDNPILQTRLCNLTFADKREKYKFYPLGVPVLKITIDAGELCVYVFGFLRICRFKRM